MSIDIKPKTLLEFFTFISGNDPVCIACKRTKGKDYVFRSGKVCICTDCHSRLPIEPHGHFTPLTINSSSKTLPSAVSILEYSGLAKSIISDYKFKNNPKYAEVLGQYLSSLLSILNSEDPIFDNETLVTAIPLPNARKCERAYNQAELIAKRAASDLCLTYDATLLQRAKDPKSRQSTLNLSQRLENLKGTFKAGNHAKDKTIIVVDDIITTGTTLREATNTLLDAGARIVIPVALATDVLKKPSQEYNMIR